MEIKSIHERLLTIDCQYSERCNLYQMTKCLECDNNKDAGENYFIDKEKLAWYRQVKNITNY